MSTVAVAKVRRSTAMHSRQNGKAVSKPSLYDALKAFDGRATDLPNDLAAQHDHYLYGTPKRAAR